MANDFVTVQRASDNELIVVDASVAKTMLDAGELVVPPNTGDALTHEDIFDDEYVPGESNTTRL